MTFKQSLPSKCLCFLQDLLIDKLFHKFLCKLIKRPNPTLPPFSSLVKSICLSDMTELFKFL